MSRYYSLFGAWFVNKRPVHQAIMAPLTEEEWKTIRDETFVHARVEPVTFRPVRNKDNNYLIDRNQQRTASMTGSCRCRGPTTLV